MTLEYQKIIKFIGRIEDYQKQKPRTECAFYGSSYDQVLPNDILAENNQHTNRIVYYQLAMATVGGTYNHLVKIFEDKKDGNEARKSMCEWYDRDVIKNETAEFPKSEPENHRFTSSQNSENDINNLLTAYRKVNKTPGESISDSHVLFIFLSGFTYPDFDIIVQIQRNSYGLLIYAVIVVRKQEIAMNRKLSIVRNMKNRLLRMVRDDEGFSYEKITRKRALRQKNTRNDIMDNRESIRFKGDFITVENKT